MSKKVSNFIIFFIINILLKIRSLFRRIRKVEFDFYSEDFKLYKNKYYFILFGKDKYVSRNTFVNGPHDFILLKKSIKILNKKISFLIDVGANVGTFCIPAVKDKIIKECIAIEPVKKIFKVLNINIYLNNLQNKIQTFDNVISNKKFEKLSLKINKDNYGDNRFFLGKKKKIQTNSIKLDNFINYFNKKKLIIKIDVQGFEDKVLMGSEKFIKSKVPLLVEFDQNFKKSKYFFKIINLFESNYRHVFFLDDGTDKKETIKVLKKKFFEKERKFLDFNCLIF